MSKKTRKPVIARKRRGIPSTNIIMTVVILVVAIAVIGGIVLFGGKDGGSAGDGSTQTDQLVPPDAHTVTEASDDKATMVEFLDYQCPACEAYYQNVTKKLEQDYSGRITFVTRNFPLDVHPLAVTAARAAEAAAEQGKYVEMYQALYDNYQSWALAPDGKNVSDDEQRARTAFDGYARTIGLDLDGFHNDMASPEVQSRIDRDRSAGEKAGVTSTPTIFVNGKRFEPSGQSFADVDRQLRDTLDGALKS